MADSSAVTSPGHEATSLVHEAVVAMRHDVTVPQRAETIHAHPTLAKVFEAAVRDVPI